jgi:leader peptidase (prepilin peptidase)/N-methyltransferase
LDTLVNALTTPFIFAFGAAIGSFLNVVVYRLPAGLSILYPPSRCPHCLHQLGKTENVPVLGWLWLKGRCRWCKSPISSRYPLVETATALLFCFVFWQFGFHLTTLGYWVFLSWLIALTLIDLDTMILPNVLTQSALVLGLGFQVMMGYQSSRSPTYLMQGVVSAVLGLWMFEIIRWVGTFALGKPAMGGGDPKLAAMIGAWLGWQNLLLTTFLACAIGSIVGWVAIALGKLNREQPVPFGPFLSLGAVLTVFFGDIMISTYLNWFQ